MSLSRKKLLWWNLSWNLFSSVSSSITGTLQRCDLRVKYRWTILLLVEDPFIWHVGFLWLCEIRSKDNAVCRVYLPSECEWRQRRRDWAALCKMQSYPCICVDPGPAFTGALHSLCLCVYREIVSSAIILCVYTSIFVSIGDMSLAVFTLHTVLLACASFFSSIFLFASHCVNAKCGSWINFFFPSETVPVNF